MQFRKAYKEIMKAYSECTRMMSKSHTGSNDGAGP
jgi:hypothetical protein